MPKRVYTKAHASVRFISDELDPLQVTTTLQLPPDHQHRNGEPRFSWTRNGSVVINGIFRQGLWSLSSKHRVGSPRLETHLAWLLDKLEPKAAEIAGLQASGVRVDFFCYSAEKSPDPPALPRAIRDRADKLAISIEIDHYQIDNG